MQAPEPSARRSPALDRHADVFGCGEALLLERLLEAHRAGAQREGYRQAIADVRAMLVWVAEDTLGRRGDAMTDARAAVYVFLEALERRIDDLPRSPFVDGGLGI